MNFDGETYDPVLDGKRLSTQLERVRAIMEDGRFHSLSELADRAGGSEASVSARLRDLRKSKFGSNDVERKRERGGLWLYRLLHHESQQMELI